MKYLSIDIGGTNIKGGIFEEATLLDTFSYPTSGKEGREKILESLDKVIMHFLKDNFCLQGIGVSSAGNIDPSTGIIDYASDNLVGFTGLDLKNYIEQRYKIKACVENDAVCFLLSCLNQENINKNVFMITFGTGIGACLYKNGKVFYGDRFDLGKFAHKIIVHNGILCDCGQNGCAEKEISSAFLSDEISKNYEEEMTIKGLFNLYREGEKRAVEILDTYFEKVNKFIDYIDTLEVDEIFISGGIAKSKDVFKSKIKSDKIKFSKHGANGALYGANSLIRGKFNDRL